jgi:hypothetical protein
MNFAIIFENAIDIAQNSFYPLLADFDKNDLEAFFNSQLSSYEYLEPSYNSEEEELNLMIQALRITRIRLGLTQTEMSNSISAICGRKVSQTTVCRFEGKILTKRNMKKLKPTFEYWIMVAEQNPALVKQIIYKQRKSY